MTTKDIFVGIRIDNIHPWFDRHKQVIRDINYPKDNMRFVYSIQDNVYKKTIAEEIKKLKDETGYNIEAYIEPHDRNLKAYGQQMSAPIFNDWKNIFDEDYFMLLDSDIVLMPKFTVKELLRVNYPITAPYVYMIGTGTFYSTWEFRMGGRRFSNQNPPGAGLLVPIQIDSAGAVMMVQGDVFKEIEFTNPYPTVMFCYRAFNRGYRTAGLPYVMVQHDNLAARRIFHSPLPRELGGYPMVGNFVSFYNRVNILNRKPLPAYPELLTLLKEVNSQYIEISDKQATDLYNCSDILKNEKSLEWAKNITKFYNFYFSKDPWKLMYQYYHEPLPEWLEIETSTYCNFKCLMCENAHWDEPDRFMSLNEFKGIIDQFPDLKWIGFSGIGEAFLNPDHRAQMRYIKDKNPNTYVEYFDQFFLQQPEVFKEWIDYSYDKVYVSFDAATKEQYEHQRPGSNYEKVISNLKLFDKIKKDEGKHYPRLCFHYIINKDNIGEAVDYIDFVADLDIDVWFIQYTRMLHSFPEIEDMRVEIPNKLVKDIQERAKKRKLEARFNVNTGNILCPSYSCNAWTQPYIYVTGHMIPCCACNERNARSTQKETAMGNIFENTLEEIWRGKKFRKLRKNIMTGKVTNCCEPCPIFNQRSSP